jgi:predicted AlkP superfamily pyrophosphatase or phosphodiesterase
MRLPVAFSFLLALTAATAACAGASTPAAPAAAPVAERTAPTAPAPAAPAATVRAIERVVIVSVDGLRPADCARLPTLGALAQQGAFAAPPDGALSVMPTVTYPAHTTMVTGMLPAHHGITTNYAPDPTPEEKNRSAWRWFREDVHAQTLYDAAYDAGLRTALLNWPVTVGARATALLPEFWLDKVTDDFKALRHLSTPGLFERIERSHPGFSRAYVPDKVLDAPVIDAALTVLADDAPQLMLVHIIEVDSAQHEYGPDSPQADAARHGADAQVARLLTALRATEAWPRTIVAVVSDHGFLPITKQIAPVVELASHKLTERVWMNGSGGFAFFYLTRPDDTEAAELTRKLFVDLARDPKNGIGAVLDRDAIAALGGDPDAFLAIEPVPGFAVSRDRTGPLVSPSKGKGTHGYLPQRPEMRATMLFYGPNVAPGVLHGARLVDLAPTVARWLGLDLGRTDGAPLSVQLTSGG